MMKGPVFTMVMVLVASGAGVAASIIVTAVCLLLKPKRLMKRNFRQAEVPAVAGLALAAGTVGAVVVLKAMLAPQIAGALVLLIGGFCVLGFIDDLYGDRTHLGLRGHLAALRAGAMTTGLLKAAGGGLLGIAASWMISGGFGDFVLNASIIVLWANVLNLFDMRPGRALKVWLGLTLIAGLVARFTAELTVSRWDMAVVAVPFVMVSMLILAIDLREVAMLGDSGSNVLGAVLGFTFISSFETVGKVVALTVAVVVQLYAERWSISDLIADRNTLRAVDELGQKGK